MGFHHINIAVVFEAGGYLIPDLLGGDASHVLMPARDAPPIPVLLWMPSQTPRHSLGIKYVLAYVRACGCACG